MKLKRKNSDNQTAIRLSQTKNQTNNQKGLIYVTES